MGSLLAALLPALLSADPPPAAPPTVAVLLARRVALSPKDASLLTAQVAAALESSECPGLVTGPDTARRLAKLGLKDATTCGGKPACLTEFGKQLGVGLLVLTSVSKVAGERSLALELYDVATGEVVEKDSLLLPKGQKLPADVLAGFVTRVKARLAPPPPVTAPKPTPLDAPVATTLTPPPPQPPLPPPPPPPEPKSHAASWALGAGALAALGAGAALLAVGLSTQGQVNAGTVGDDGRLRSPLTTSEAQAKSGAAGLQLGLAGAAAAVGLGLSTTAVLLW